MRAEQPAGQSRIYVFLGGVSGLLKERWAVAHDA